MRLAAGVERASEHPLALAIVEAATVRSLPVPDVTDFDSPVGRGVIGTVEGRVLVLGSSDFLNSHHIDTADLRDRADELRGDGATVIYMGADGWLVGLFAIADPIKATTPAALKALREEGIRIFMLTGDNKVTAHAVAKTLGIDQVEAEVLPDHKSDIVTKLRGEGRVVAMAGDGVNDAPALAAADVGIAMGSGTDVAMESAGVTLLKGDLTGIVRARELSEKTMRNIRQNLFFAFVYNALGIPSPPASSTPFSESCSHRSSPPQPWPYRASASSATPSASAHKQSPETTPEGHARRLHDPTGRADLCKVPRTTWCSLRCISTQVVEIVEMHAIL